MHFWEALNGWVYAAHSRADAAPGLFCPADVAAAAHVAADNWHAVLRRPEDFIVVRWPTGYLRHFAGG